MDHVRAVGARNEVREVAEFEPVVAPLCCFYCLTSHQMVLYNYAQMFCTMFRQDLLEYNYVRSSGLS